MPFKLLHRCLLLTGVFLVSVGFRVFPGTKGWKIDDSSIAKRKVFITLVDSGKTIYNNLPDTDSLFNAGSSLTATQILPSIISNFNSIQDSNLILALDSDPDFAANRTDHQITIEDAAASGVSSGEANTTSSGQYMTNCKISLTDKAYESAKGYVALVTHELGHCLGLDHSQDTVWAVMSYFYNDEVYRLAIDDKMGLVYLYGKNSSFRDEKSTLGMSCSSR